LLNQFNFGAPLIFQKKDKPKKAIDKILSFPLVDIEFSVVIAQMEMFGESHVRDIFKQR